MLGLSSRCEDLGKCTGSIRSLLIRLPKLIRGTAPIYPISQLQQHKSGGAVISFTIDEQGKTRGFRVISTNYPYFASHAILAVQRWQFEPARKNGHPVAVRLRVPFNYRTPKAGAETPF